MEENYEFQNFRDLWVVIQEDLKKLIKLIQLKDSQLTTIEQSIQGQRVRSENLKKIREKNFIVDIKGIFSGSHWKKQVVCPNFYLLNSLKKGLESVIKNIENIQQNSSTGSQTIEDSIKTYFNWNYEGLARLLKGNSGQWKKDSIQSIKFDSKKGTINHQQVIIPYLIINFLCPSPSGACDSQDNRNECGFQEVITTVVKDYFYSLNRFGDSGISFQECKIKESDVPNICTLEIALKIRNIDEDENGSHNSESTVSNE